MPQSQDVCSACGADQNVVRAQRAEGAPPPQPPPPQAPPGRQQPAQQQSVCSRCSRIISAGTRYCSYCGADQGAPPAYPPQPGYSQGWVCPHCQLHVGYGHVACPRCGYGAPARNAGPVGGWIAGAILLSVASLCVCPIGMGAMAIYCGYQVKKAGNEGAGIGLMIASAAMMVAGIVVGAIVVGSQRLGHIPFR